MVSLIAKKRDGLPLDNGEIEHLVHAVSKQVIDHVQIGEYNVTHLSSFWPLCLLRSNLLNSLLKF